MSLLCLKTKIALTGQSKIKTKKKVDNANHLTIKYTQYIYIEDH